MNTQTNEMEMNKIDAIAMGFGDNIPANRRELLMFILEDMDNDTLIDLWNERCQNGSYDDEIYPLDEYHINEVLCPHRTPFEMLRAFADDFNPHNDYVMFNGYGVMVSFDDPREHIYISDLADYLVRNNIDTEKFEDWEDEIMYAFLHKATDLDILTDEEISDLDWERILDTDWCDYIHEIISDRE